MRVPRRVLMFSGYPNRTWQGHRLVVSADVAANEIYNFLGRSTREEDLGDAGLFQGGDIRFRNNSTDKHGHVFHVFGAQQVHQMRAERVVRPGKNGKPDDVHIFLFGGGGDHFGSLAQAGVYDLHAGVAQRTGNDFGATVMAIEPRLGNQYTNFSF